MSKIIERIQKLLRLAQNAGSEAEAALAAQRAADMMAEHEIHEAELALANTEKPREPEPIEKAFQVTSTKKKVAWQMRVVNSTAQTYGASAYWIGGRITLFGRLSAVQATNYTAQYLMREVERITDREAPSKQYSKSYRNAFRLGCANRVAARLAEEEERKRKAAAPPAPAPTVVTEEDLDEVAAANDADATDAPAPEPAEPDATAKGMALAIIEKDREEVRQEYAKFSAKWRSGPSIGKVSNGSGYAAGRAAGDRVNLGGRSKGGLPKGQDTFPV